MPLDDSAFRSDCPTATGSSVSPSRWLAITSGSVPAAFTCANQVCHWLARPCGLNANDGPTISAPGAMRRISRTPVSHIWKYWVLLTLAFGQNAEMSGSFHTSYANLTPEPCSAPTVESMKLTQLAQLPFVHGHIVLAGCPPSAPYMSLRIAWYCVADPSRLACDTAELTSACVPEPNW